MQKSGHDWLSAGAADQTHGFHDPAGVTHATLQQAQTAPAGMEITNHESGPTAA